MVEAAHAPREAFTDSKKNAESFFDRCHVRWEKFG